MVMGPKHLRAGTDGHPVANGGMALARFLARAAQGYALVDGYVIANHRGFANHDAIPVIDEKSLANNRPGMNLNARAMPGALGDPACQHHMALFIKPVCPSVRPYSP